MNDAAQVKTQGVPIEKGQILLVDEGEGRGWRYKLWAVSSVRKTAKGATVTLLGWSPGCLAKATATFPDGLVAEPWQVFALSQRDLALVWESGKREVGA